MIKPLLFLLDYRKTEGASGQIQRVFWENLDKGIFTPTIICNDGDITSGSTCKIIIEKSRRWLELIPRLLRKIGLPDLCNCPDIYVFSWAPFAYFRAKRLLKKERYDYVSSISYPHSSHLIAYWVKKETGMPWVAQFFDPWIENSSNKYKLSLFSSLNNKLENLVALNADIIIHSNDKMVENWMNRYGTGIATKIVKIPFSYNIKSMPDINLQRKRKDKLQISHIGHIYGGRSTSDFIEAVSLLVREDSSLLEKLSISYVGITPQNEKDLTKELGLSSIFTFYDTLPPEELEDFYNDTDIFLLVDVKLDKSPFFPSKLMMYQYYRRPIIAITTKDSAIEKELDDANYPVFYYGKVGDIHDFIKLATEDYKSLFTFDNNRWRNYELKYVSELYNKTILTIKKRDL